MNRADATVTREHRPESAGDPRVQIYQGRISPGPMLRANLVTVLARAAVMWPMWVLMGLALAGVASYGLHLGVPARYVLTYILTRTTLAALGFVAAVTLIRTARTYLAQRTGVPPHVLVDPDRPHPVEPCRVVEQHALAFGQDRVVGRIPRHSKSFGDPGHGQVLHHDPFQRPGQGAPGQPGPRLGGGAGVLPPHVRAAGAPVPADLELQRGGSPAERFVRELPGHGIPGDPFAAAAAAPPVRLDDAARDDSPVGLEPLADGFKSEFVETGERRQVRLGEVSAFGSASTTNRCHAILSSHSPTSARVTSGWSRCTLWPARSSAMYVILG